LGLVAKAVSKTEVVARPVIVAVAGVVQVLALMELVGSVTWIFATTAAPLIEVGVIAPRVKVMAGVVVAVATVPDTPLAVTTETEVTVPVPPPISEGDPLAQMYAWLLYAYIAGTPLQ
jgi:hypothetical protein